TKKLSTIDATSAAMRSQPCAPRSKYDAGSTACMSLQLPACEIATGMPMATTPTSSRTTWTQSVYVTARYPPEAVYRMTTAPDSSRQVAYSQPSSTCRIAAAATSWPAV